MSNRKGVLESGSSVGIIGKYLSCGLESGFKTSRPFGTLFGDGEQYRHQHIHTGFVALPGHPSTINMSSYAPRRQILTSLLTRYAQATQKAER